MLWRVHPAWFTGRHSVSGGRFDRDWRCSAVPLVKTSSAPETLSRGAKLDDVLGSARGPLRRTPLRQQGVRRDARPARS